MVVFQKSTFCLLWTKVGGCFPQKLLPQYSHTVWLALPARSIWFNCKLYGNHAAVLFWEVPNWVLHNESNLCRWQLNPSSSVFIKLLEFALRPLDICVCQQVFFLAHIHVSLLSVRLYFGVMPCGKAQIGLNAQLEIQIQNGLYFTMWYIEAVPWE